MVADSQEAADCDNVTRYTSPYPPSKKRNLQNPTQEHHLVGRHIIKDMSLATVEYSQKLSSGWWWTLPAAGHQKNKMMWPSEVIPCYKLLVNLKGQCAKICGQWAPTKLMECKTPKTHLILKGLKELSGSEKSKNPNTQLHESSSKFVKLLRQKQKQLNQL